MKYIHIILYINPTLSGGSGSHGAKYSCFTVGLIIIAWSVGLIYARALIIFLHLEGICILNRGV